MTQKKKTGISRLLEFGGRYRWMTVVACILSGLSSVLMLCPFLCIWLVLRDVLAALPAAQRTAGNHMKGKTTMIKRYLNTAILYAILAMIFGVFYREFTKFNHFTGKTNLSVMHTHYFLLGMFFFLFLMLLEQNFGFSSQPNTGKLLVTYQLGLNITALGFLMRGLTQVWGTALSRTMDSSISGVAGIGHILMGVSLILLLLKIKKQVS